MKVTIDIPDDYEVHLVHKAATEIPDNNLLRVKKLFADLPKVPILRVAAGKPCGHFGTTWIAKEAPEPGSIVLPYRGILIVDAGGWEGAFNHELQTP